MNRLKGLSLFANVGVAEAYLKEIGVDVIIANELIPDRAKFYQDVYPSVDMICGDITDPNIRNQIVNKAIKNSIDIIIATPPCQGMSIAGNMDPLDERNFLIFYAVDVIKRVKPKYVFIENVPRILITKIRTQDTEKIIPDYLKEELSDYSFNDNTLIKAMDYGVPQMRERNVFLLTRKDQLFIWNFPEKKKKTISLREAIGDLPPLDPYVKEGYEETIKMFPDFEEKKKIGLKISKWHYPPTHNKRQIEWMQHTSSGESATNNEVYFPQKPDGTRIVAHYNHYRRHNWDKPCRTITQNNGVISSLCCVHPGRFIGHDKEGLEIYSDPRVLSIYELLIVSSLPKNWPIPDWANETLIRHVIGEGIPPLLVKEIMLELIKKIKENHNG